MSVFDIDGIKIGHAQDAEAGTGVTVILCERGAVGAVDVRGGGPATRETDLLRPENTVESVNAIVLSGGSAFGLDAAGGVMRFLEERGCGFPTGIIDVPIVCGASLFDLGVGSAHVRPDAAMGHAACEAAAGLTVSPEGNVGAGMGATVGKMSAPDRAMKSGLGIDGACLSFGPQPAGGTEGGVPALKVVAVSAVNAVGTVVDADGSPIAGVVSADGSRVLTPPEAMGEFLALVQQMAAAAAEEPSPVANTTISCVVTNARLAKAQAAKVASMAHDGYARAIDPVHTTMDGDTVFVLATGEVDAMVDVVGILAADAVAGAIRNAARKAAPAFGLRAAGDFE